MGEFRGQSEEIISILNENNMGKMDISNITKITSDVVGGKVNCYPGIPGEKCYPGAYFYSVEKKKYKGTRGMNLSLDYVFSKMTQHLIGSCEGETKYAVLITDNWNDHTYNQWKSTFDKIRKNVHIEMYLITSGNCLEIKI